ncbi:Zinc finger C2H2-type [Trinorchestia longiramus]|nr:Zinc finger C2H2-type [Trinorchestia longiramus]
MGDEPKRAKRGRPPAEAISKLIIEGHQSTHKVKCKYCYRTFPRDKSLTAHVRTHTGEKPFLCTFPVPRCGKSFKQSGHLRTHERLHTDDYCFKCPVENCKMRFKHTNRSCSNHPNAKLVRETEPGYPDNLLTEEVLKTEHPDVIEWLRGYIQRFKNSRKTPDKRGGSKASKRKQQDNFLDSSQTESLEQSYDLNDTSAQNLSVSARESYNNRREIQNSVLASIFASPVSQVCNSSERYQMNSAGSSMLDCSASTADYSFSNNLDSSSVSSPRRDQSLLTVNESDIACTPTRSTVFSTPVESPYLATPKNATRQFNANHDSSHFSTPGQSSYGTPLGKSTMFTSNESVCFSTPLDTKLHFPGLVPDFTSTPVAGLPDTPDHTAPGSLPRASCGPLRKNLTMNKRIKSRRILGPLMEATHSRVNTNTGASMVETSDHRPFKSQVSDENSYGQSDGVAKNFPSSPQHSRVFRNKQNQLLPSKKSDALLCLDMDGIKPINDEGLPYVYRDSLFSSNASYSLGDDRSSSFLHHQNSAKVTSKMTTEPVTRSSNSPNCAYSRSEESHIPVKAARMCPEADPAVIVKMEPETTDATLHTSDALQSSEEHRTSILKSSESSSNCMSRVFTQNYPASSSTSMSVQTESASTPHLVKTNSAGRFMSYEEQNTYSPRSAAKCPSRTDNFLSMQISKFPNKFHTMAPDGQRSYQNASGYSRSPYSWPALSPVRRSQTNQHHQVQYIDEKLETGNYSFNNDAEDAHVECSSIERLDQLSVLCYSLNRVPETTNSLQTTCSSYNERLESTFRSTSCQRKLPFSQTTSQNDIKLTDNAPFSTYYEPISPASPDLDSKSAADEVEIGHEEARLEGTNIVRSNLEMVSSGCVGKLTSSQQSSYDEDHSNRRNTENDGEMNCQSSSDVNLNILCEEKLNCNENYFEPQDNMQSESTKIVTAEPDSSSNQHIVGSLTVRTKAARKSYTPTKRFSSALMTISPHKVYPKKRWMSRVNAQAKKTDAWRSFNSSLNKDEEVVTNSGAHSDYTVTSGTNFSSSLNLSIDEVDSTLTAPITGIPAGSVPYSDPLDDVSSTVSSLGNTSFDDIGFTCVTAAQVDITVTSGISPNTNLDFEDSQSDANVRFDDLSYLDGTLPSNEPLNLSTR